VTLEETIGVSQPIGRRYRLTERLGSGAHGEVWLAEDTELGRLVALKRLRSNDPRSVAERQHALHREARMLAQLAHPNVVSVHDVVVDSDELWLIMEYVSAGSLADLGRTALERSARFAAQLADVLAAMQRKGMLHCDIKPSNVLLGEDDRIILSDFGLSRLPDGAFTLPADGQIVGTPEFMAPELAAGESEPTPASDVFSLGATIYALVEGHSPYGETSSAQQVLRLAAQGVVIKPRRAGMLTPLLTRMLDRDPARRPTAAQVRDELAALGCDVPKTTRAGRWQMPRSLPRPRGRWTFAAFAGAVVVAVAVVLISSQGHPATPTSVAHPKALDPAKIDPCGLVDVAALDRFGETDRSDDSGNFNRCDIYVSTATGDVDVKIELETAAEAGGVPQGQVTHSGDLTIVAEPADDGECDQAIVLNDHNQVDITASYDSDDKSTVSLCTVATVATDRVVHTLVTGGLPQRRSLPPSWSWFHVDACGLLDAKALAQFPGVDALHPDIGFNDWECVWHSTTSSASLRVRFDRSEPLSAADGQPIRLADHPAFVEPNDYSSSSCEVAVQGRRYTDDQSQPTVELLLVVVEGQQPTTEMCGQAKAIAGAAAAKLPS
jgi:hypothetical protein